MPTNRSLSYDATGVLDNTQLGLGALLRWVNKTAAFRGEGQPGRRVVDVGFFASEPISFLDYIAIESAIPRVLEEIAEGLYRGAELAGVAIVGGEISQIPDIIKGHAPGRGLDLVGMCAGIVPLSRIILGREVAPGDIIIGVRSSGIHSNGLTLARRALLDEGKLKADQYVADLGRTVGEELLQPTHIYVRPVVDLVNRQRRLSEFGAH